jgi:hypothetical protein
MGSIERKQRRKEMGNKTLRAVEQATQMVDAAAEYVRCRALGLALPDWLEASTMDGRAALEAMRVPPRGAAGSGGESGSEEGGSGADEGEASSGEDKGEEDGEP